MDDTEMEHESDDGSPVLGPLGADDRLVTEQIDNIMDSRLRPEPRRRNLDAEMGRPPRKAKDIRLPMRPAKAKSRKYKPLSRYLKEGEMFEVEVEEEHEVKIEGTAEVQDHVKLETDADEPHDTKAARKETKGERRQRIKAAIPDGQERNRFYLQHTNLSEEDVQRFLEGLPPREKGSHRQKRVRKAIPNSYERKQFYREHDNDDPETINKYFEGLRQIDTALRVIALYGSPDVGVAGANVAMDDYEAQDAENFADIEMEIGPY